MLPLPCNRTRGAFEVGERYAVHFQEIARRRVVVFGGRGEVAVHHGGYRPTPMLTTAASAYGCAARGSFAALMVSLGEACAKSRTTQEILQRTLNVRDSRWFHGRRVARSDPAIPTKTPRAESAGNGWRLPGVEGRLDVWGLKPSAAGDFVRERLSDFSLRCFEESVALPTLRPAWIERISPVWPSTTQRVPFSDPSQSAPNARAGATMNFLRATTAMRDAGQLCVGSAYGREATHRHC